MLRRLLPEPGDLSVEELLDAYSPWENVPADRPRVAMNFAATVDGQATIGGVSGPIGSSTDTAMLSGLRRRFDAVMIGAGTMRAERYGPLPDERLMVLVSGRLDLPWDAPLFTAGKGRVVIFTASAEAEAPETPTEVELVRHERGIEIAAALTHLREEEGIRALLCEGGPRLHAELQAAGLVDELFLTIAPKLGIGGGPRILEGDLPGPIDLELAWLLELEGELFARYRRPNRI